MHIPLIKPYIPANAIEMVATVLASGHLSEGLLTSQFESAFANFCGATHAIAVTSCTAGLELALRALGIGPGDEVIVPGYTYPATAEAVMLTGATAVIVDCNPLTLNIDYTALQAAITSRTRCIMPVSLFGNPLDWDILNELASKYGLSVVEDAACGFGSSYRGRRTGSLGTITVFSLHPRKCITTGEGGMITTEDANLARLMRSMKCFGMECKYGNRENLHFVRLGTNLKMSDILAAVGLAQINEASAILNRRAQQAKRYHSLLPASDPEEMNHSSASANPAQLYWPQVTSGGEHSWQSCCVLIPQRNRVLQSLRAEGIEVQIGTYALHREPLFQKHPLCRINGSTQGSQQAYEQTLALPLYHQMSDTQLAHVASRLKAILGKQTKQQPTVSPLSPQSWGEGS